MGKNEVQKSCIVLFLLCNVAVNPLEIELSENLYIHKFFNNLFAYIINFTENQTQTKTPVKYVSLIKERLSQDTYSQFYYTCSKALKVFSCLISELYHKLRKVNFFKLLLQQKCSGTCKFVT